MDKRLKKLVSGLSVTGLIMASSLPVMGDELGSDAAKTTISQTAVEKSQGVKTNALSGKTTSVKDNVGKGDCGPGGTCVKNKSKVVKTNVNKAAGTAPKQAVEEKTK